MKIVKKERVTSLFLFQDLNQMKFTIFQGLCTGETPQSNSSDAIAFPNIQRLNIKPTDKE